MPDRFSPSAGETYSFALTGGKADGVFNALLHDRSGPSGIPDSGRWDCRIQTPDEAAHDRDEQYARVRERIARVTSVSFGEVTIDNGAARQCTHWCRTFFTPEERSTLIERTVAEEGDLRSALRESWVTRRVRAITDTALSCLALCNEEADLRLLERQGDRTALVVRHAIAQTLLAVLGEAHDH